MTTNNSCVAISSPPGVGAISLIRICGDDALQIVGKTVVLKNGNSLQNMPSHTVAFGEFLNEKGEKLDEVLVSVFLSPNSFTGENTVEICCHGGVRLTQMIQEVILKNGAKLAEPGEFSKRAFLNGKIDLSKAEAIIDLINSKTDLAVISNAGQVSGKLSEKINSIRDKALLTCAKILAKVDFPEDEIDEIFNSQAHFEIQGVLCDIIKLLGTFETGRILNQGLKAVIAGKPNVGKSSLLNALLSEDRAIVTATPGTTRDVIEASLIVNGIPILISDTAGIRTAESEIEHIGINKAYNKITNADLVIVIFDANCHLSDDDMKIIEVVKDKKIVVLVNKIDLEIEIDLNLLEESFVNSKIVMISTKTGQGIDELKETIQKMFLNEDIKIGQDAIVANIRQKDSLVKAHQAFEQASMALSEGFPADVVTIDINLGISALGEINGLMAQEQVIEKIFSQFCIGK